MSYYGGKRSIFSKLSYNSKQIDLKAVNCLIVDDEPIASKIIQNYCSYLPLLNVVASCMNALEARKALLEHQIDIMFLDINMPVLNGISFLKNTQRSA